jgi:molecular chaperone GrpE (heat shock protein)
MNTPNTPPIQDATAGNKSPVNLENPFADLQALVEHSTPYAGHYESLQANVITELARCLRHMNNQMDKIRSDISQSTEDRSKSFEQLSELTEATTRLSNQSDQLSTKLDAQVRLVDRLTADFIEDQFENPWIKVLAETTSILKREANNGCQKQAPEIRAQAEKIERRIRDIDVEWIRPKTGEQFDPKRHSAIQATPTTNQAAHGQISETFSEGLLRNQRIIQHAKVSVYRFQKVSQEN